ncbi:hypothetical protein SAMN03159444_01407 [Pseudomonas sp. NFACC02]|nr:hypothetical protein SAMN03159444_01407 [Pseudomonas sp. NFACC02]
MPRAPQAVPQPQVPEPSAAIDVNAEVGHLDRAITTALNAAVAGGLPNGYIVAVLHAHALKQTQLLLG